MHPDREYFRGFDADAPPAKRSRVGLSVRDGFRFGFGFAVGLMAFWLSLIVAVLILYATYQAGIAFSGG